MELLRGVFDAAMRIHLNRFLNIPPATIPKKSIHDKVIDPDTVLRALPELLDRQQSVNETGQVVAEYLYRGGRSTYINARKASAARRPQLSYYPDA
jgi:hypothetical protein